VLFVLSLLLVLCVLAGTEAAAYRSGIQGDRWAALSVIMLVMLFMVGSKALKVRRSG
jgi:hypothetical protein